MEQAASCPTVTVLASADLVMQARSLQLHFNVLVLLTAQHSYVLCNFSRAKLNSCPTWLAAAKIDSSDLVCLSVFCAYPMHASHDAV